MELKERVDAILPHLDEEDAMRVKIMANVVVTSKKKCAAKPTNANRKAWFDAESALSDELERLERSVQRKPSEPDVPKYFKSMQAVSDYLTSLGYRASKSAVYKHKQRGLLKKGKKGYAKKDVDRYAKSFLSLPPGAPGVISQVEDDGLKGEPEGGDLITLQEQKLRAEIAIKRAQAKKAELQNEILLGKYIRRSDHERSIAAACGVLEAGLKHFFKLRAQDMIELVNGDLSETTALVVYLCEHLDLELTKFAKMAPVEVEIDA